MVQMAPSTATRYYERAVRYTGLVGRLAELNLIVVVIRKKLLIMSKTSKMLLIQKLVTTTTII